MGILAWIIFGALAGWVASLIMNTDEEQGAIANVIIGVVGAMVGGFVARAVGGAGVTGFNFGSLLVAILGAVILLGVYKMVANRT